LKRKSRCCEARPGLSGGHYTTLITFLMLASLMLLIAACGGTTAGSGEEEPGTSEEEPAENEASPGEETSEVALAPADAMVGEDEETAMPANYREEDRAQRPPENPPEGVRTFPATTNGNYEPPIYYEREPPTNGDHAPYWQRCGFYSTPIENEAAVHSLDHGAVWVTYRPDLSQGELDTLRNLAREAYVLVSPYEGLSAPVIVTAWRNQLDLEGTDDPRLRQFVDQFRVSETAPRSGNGCENGRGEPEVASAATL
jgi:Protein of unknown function (DUF3105)